MISLNLTVVQSNHSAKTNCLMSYHLWYRPRWFVNLFKRFIHKNESVADCNFKDLFKNRLDDDSAIIFGLILVAVFINRGAQPFRAYFGEILIVDDIVWSYRLLFDFRDSVSHWYQVLRNHFFLEIECLSFIFFIEVTGWWWFWQAFKMVSEHIYVRPILCSECVIQSV